MRTSTVSGVILAGVLAMPALAGDPSTGYQPYGGPVGFQPGGLFYAEAPAPVLPDATLRLRGSVGVLLLQADEYVFNGDRVLSQLIWQSRAPVLRGGADLNLGHGFSLSAAGSVAALGESYMEDYDWLTVTDSFDDWTHQSKHPDTRLDHYVSLELAGGYELARTETTFVRAQAGLRYTDLQWAASGGSYIYSTHGFRDTIGAIPAGVPAITYRQQLPEVFVGVDGEEHYGAFRLGGMLRGGLTVLARATDNHWLRDLRIEDSFGVAPTVSAGLDAGYALGSMAELFVAARYDQALTMRGRAEYYDTVTGALALADDDIAGAALRSISLTAGLKGQF